MSPNSPGLSICSCAFEAASADLAPCFLIAESRARAAGSTCARVTGEEFWYQEGMQFMVISLVLLASPTLAADAAADRLEPVLAARLELQRNLRTELEGALTPIVAPSRVLIRVEAILQARFGESTRTEETPGTEIMIKPMRQAELPGLPVVRQQVVGVGTPQMEYRVPGRKITQRTPSVEAEVTRLTVKVFLDEAVPEDLRAEVKRVVVALAGLDTARGDVLELSNLPPVAAASRAGLDRLAPGWLYTLVAVLTVLLGALLVALLLSLGVGLGRKSGASADARGDVSDGSGRAGAMVGSNDGAAAVAGLAPAALASGPFAGLAGCSADELVGILGDLPDADAAVLLAALSGDQGGVQRVFGRLAPTRQLALGQWMVTSHVVERTEVERVASAAQAGLAKARSWVSLGGPDQLASLVAEAPAEMLKQLLDALEARDASVAAELRLRMPFFDDLEQLEAPVIRAVVTQLDPAVLALALASATPALREHVYRSVSKRLRAILVSEGEGLAKPPQEKTDGARRQVELIMRRSRVKKGPSQSAVSA